VSEPGPGTNVQLDASFHLAVLSQGVAGHVADVRAALRSLDDGTYAVKADTARPGAFLQFKLGSSGDSDEGARTRLCNRCFVGMVGELITFIDRMIAFRRLLGTQMKVPPTVNTPQAVSEFVHSRLEEAYREVATDTSLSNPKKLTTFAGINDLSRRAALSYFSVRRAIEHHGHSPQTNIDLVFGRMRLLAGDAEIVETGQVLPEGTGISVGLHHSMRELASGIEIAVREDELEHVAFTIQLLIGPEIARVASGLPPT